jgi:hypothetical protein
MVCLVAGPPNLCRAGVVVECCEHEQPESPVATGDTLCCNDHRGSCDDQQPPAREKPRQCGTCADICANITKPSEGLNYPAFAGCLLVPNLLISYSLTLQPTVCHLEPTKFLQKLPFHTSDVPLLI